MVPIKKCDEFDSTGVQHYLKQHILTVHGKVKQCDICEEIFSCKTTLIRLIKSNHKDLEPFLCHICLKGFDRSDNLVNTLELLTR